jgi:hypothetical protein
MDRLGHRAGIHFGRRNDEKTAGVARLERCRLRTSALPAAVSQRGCDETR